MNPLALLMSRRIQALSPEYAGQLPQTPQDMGAYYQAMNVMRGMPMAQQPATDYENEENMRRYAAARGPEGFGPDNMYARREPGTERMWEYAGGVPPIPEGVPEAGEAEAVAKEGWRPIADFIKELKPFAHKLPPPLRMKMSKLEEMVGSIRDVNMPEPFDQDTADLGAAYGPSSADMNSELEDALEALRRGK